MIEHFEFIERGLCLARDAWYGLLYVIGVRFHAPRLAIYAERKMTGAESDFS